jgi:hypothetical protein
MNSINSFFSPGDLAKLGAPIWERVFNILVSYKDSLSEDHIRMFGMPTTGDAQFDSGMHNDMVSKFFTIDQMVEYYKKGIVFYVKDHRETKDIYDIVSSYLLCWKQHLDTGINVGGAPLEDLINLDRFASSVHDHAVEHFSDNYIKSNLMKFIGNRKIGRSSFEKSVEVPVVVANEVQVKKRESLASLFSERVFTINGGR